MNCFLDDVSSDYNFILIDNSVFQEVLTFNSIKQTSAERLAHCYIQKKSLEFWIKNLPEYDNLYTTLGVMGELAFGTNYDYKRAIKRPPSSKDPNIPKIRRAIRDVSSKRRSLIGYLKDEDKILKLNEDEQSLYKKLSEKYYKCGDYYKLSEVDFDLFLSGAVCAQTCGSSAILSNDIRGISELWKLFLKKEHIPREKFGFFVRDDISLFRKWNV